jgi:hypothetical protein
MPINYQRKKNTDVKFGGSEGVEVPAGASDGRGLSPALGTLRYNTDTGLAEFYTSNGWSGVDAPPVVSGVSGTINEDTDSTLTINGSNFKSGSIVYIEGAAVNSVPRALVTTFVNSTQLTAATNATSISYVGNASFNVKVLNPSGLSSVLEPAGTIDRDPVWVTGSGSLGTIDDRLVPGAQTYQYSASGTTYQVVKFLAPGTYTWFSPLTGTIDALIVGGGGSAGSNNGGGGGAGGVLLQSGVAVSQGSSYTITVGAGGRSYRLAGASGENGQNSTAFGFTAVGGGGGMGGNYGVITSSGTPVAGNGGSGGGQSRNVGSPGTGTAGQGKNGRVMPSNSVGGGGGGATQGQAEIGTGSAGGNGFTTDIDGTSRTYGGGGGGGDEGGNAPPAGGTGGGGRGAGIGGGITVARRYGTAGTANTGGGGGGDINGDSVCGGGGSGIVVIRYIASAGQPQRFALSANDPDGTAVTYSLAGGSLPSGLTLNSSGLITGYTSDVSNSTSASFDVAVTSNSQTETRNFSITLAPYPKRMLVWVMSNTGSSGVASPTLRTLSTISTSDQGVALIDWTTFPYWTSWTRVCFTSLLNPNVQWRFERTPLVENLVKTFMSPYSRWSSYGQTGTVITGYAVGPGSSIRVGDVNIAWQHNNGGGERFDIPTLGNSGGNVWETGMFWGQIDDPSNYGGLMNRVTPQVGSSGGNTGDTLLIYLETDSEISPSSYTNYLTPTGPHGDARSVYSWTYSGSSGIGGSPERVADAVSRDTTTDWPTYGFQQQGNDSWIRVDLGSARATAFDYAFAIGYPGGSHFGDNNTIEGSNDGSNWTVVSRWNFHNYATQYSQGYLIHDSGRHTYGNTIDNAYKWIPMDNSVAYRYYRLRTQNTNVSNGYQLVMNWGLLKKNT